MSTRRQRERRYAYMEEVEKERQAEAKRGADKAKEKKDFKENNNTQKNGEEIGADHELWTAEK